MSRSATEALQAWIAASTSAALVAVDTETTGLDEMRADLVGVSLALAPGRPAYIPLGHVTGDGDLLRRGECAPPARSTADGAGALKPVLEDPRSSRSART
jgi:DNA polymerase I